MNQTLPSGPAAMSYGLLAAFGSGNSVTAPAVVTRAMRFPSNSVNHMFPSGPAAIRYGELPALIPAENSVTVPAG